MEIIKLFNKNKNMIIKVMLSLLTYVAFLIYFKIVFTKESYDILSFVGYIGILYFYLKVDGNFDKRIKKYSFWFSLFLSSILIIGSKVNQFVYLEPQYIFNLNRIISTIVGIIGFTVFLYYAIGTILPYLLKIEINSKDKNKMSTKTFILLVLLMFGLWLPYFLRFYPAIMTPDSYFVIHNVNSNILSDLHTFGHTWFFGFFFNIGKFLFNNLNMAVAFYIIIQMLIMSSIFNIAIKYFYDNGLKKGYVICLFLFFALNPLHAHYSVTLWRDVPFGLAFLLLIVSLIEMVKNNWVIKKRYWIMFIISILSIMFFRNNGIYVYVFMLPFLLFICRRKKIWVNGLYIFLLIFYFVIKGPVFDYFDVGRTRTTEAYSIPLQQIARVVAMDKKIDKDLYNELNKYVEINSVKGEYRSMISDPIKRLSNNEMIDKNKSSFIKSWGKLLLQHPRIYIEAYLLQSLGYWYPNTVYWATAGESKQFFPKEKVYSDPITNEKFNQLLDYSSSRGLPLSIFIWSLGLQFLILVISAIIILYKKYYKKLLVFVPLLGLWVTIMIATPVFSELRYVYGLFVCAPFLLFLSLINNDIVIKKQKGK